MDEFVSWRESYRIARITVSVTFHTRRPLAEQITRGQQIRCRTRVKEFFMFPFSPDAGPCSPSRRVTRRGARRLWKEPLFWGDVLVFATCAVVEGPPAGLMAAFAFRLGVV